MESHGDSYVTVQVPLYVSYISARGPALWRVVEYKTELEVSFHYTPVLQSWNTDFKTQLDAYAQVSSVIVDLPVTCRSVLFMRATFWS